MSENKPVCLLTFSAWHENFSSLYNEPFLYTKNLFRDNKSEAFDGGLHKQQEGKNELYSLFIVKKMY